MNRVKEAKIALQKNKKQFYEKGITSCEIQGSRCQGAYMLGFAHRHKRRWYYDEPKLLHDFKQVVLACAQCHSEIEYDSELTEEVFMRLRGEE